MKIKKDGDFRATFSKFADESLISTEEIADLIGSDRSGVYRGLRKKWLPAPVVRANRQMLWRVADVRAWMRNMTADVMVTADTPIRKLGRPREHAGDASMIRGQK